MSTLAPGQWFLLLACLLAMPSAQAEIHEVQLLILGGTRFEPNDLTIQAGDTVRWINGSGFHSVDADDGSFAMPATNFPWQFERTFDEPGVVLYHCIVHSSPGLDINQFMNGRITVEPAGATEFAINQGISASWFNEATSGQGFLIDVRPEDQFMFVAWFTFDVGAEKLGFADQRWLIATGFYEGNTADLELLSVSGGVFDLTPASIFESVGTLELSFSDCANGLVEYAIPAEDLQGQIAITRAVPGTESLCETLAEVSEPAAEQ